MATPISENFSQEFSETFRILQQEAGGQLREGVNTDVGIVGDSKYYDQFGSLEMDEITNRHGDTEISTFEHERRKLVLTPFDKAVMVDNPDQVRTLFDPTNPYMRALLMSAGRREDKTIIDAFDAPLVGNLPVSQNRRCAVMAEIDIVKLSVDAIGVRHSSCPSFCRIPAGIRR